MISVFQREAHGLEFKFKSEKTNLSVEISRGKLRWQDAPPSGVFLSHWGKMSRWCPPTSWRGAVPSFALLCIPARIAPDLDLLSPAKKNCETADLLRQQHAKIHAITHKRKKKLHKTRIKNKSEAIKIFCTRKTFAQSICNTQTLNRINKSRRRYMDPDFWDRISDRGEIGFTSFCVRELERWFARKHKMSRLRREQKAAASFSEDASVQDRRHERR
jgi:hypothetical protein